MKIGETAPDFEAETTQGRIRFHDWIGDSWAVLFSHPKEFTPVCTTELGYMARIKPEFDRRNVKVIGLSVDSTGDHEGWAKDIEETQGHPPFFHPHRREMNPASSPEQTAEFISRLATATMAATLAVIALFGFGAAPTTRAEAPASELKLAGAIPLTTELLDKMEKFFTSAKSDAAAKAELVAVIKENKDNPPMTGEAWGSLISAKCPKTMEIFQASGLTPEEFGKAALAIQAIIFGDAMAPPGDKDNMAKSEDKAVAANAAFVAANRARAEAVYGGFVTLGL